MIANARYQNYRGTYASISHSMPDVLITTMGCVDKEEVIDRLFQCEVMSSELWETLKTEFWNRRKKSSYELPNWK